MKKICLIMTLGIFMLSLIVANVPSVNDFINPVTDSPDPVQQGQLVTFTGTANGSLGYDYSMTICDSIGFSCTKTFARGTCLGKKLCSSSVVASGETVSCTYNTSDDVGTVDWRAYTCNINGDDWSSYNLEYAYVNSPFTVIAGLNLCEGLMCEQSETICQDGFLVSCDNTCDLVTGECSECVPDCEGHDIANQEIMLYERNPITWKIVKGGSFGKLVVEFGSFVFTGKKLQRYTDYTLIQGINLPEDQTCLASGTSDKWRSVNFLGNLEGNGLDFWLVLSDDVNCSQGMTSYNPSEYLFG